MKQNFECGSFQANPKGAVLLSSNAINTATNWDIFDNDDEDSDEKDEDKDEERLIDHSAPINVDAMNTEYMDKSNQVWDSMEKDRWLYNLDGDEGILPKFKN